MVRASPPTRLRRRPWGQACTVLAWTVLGQVGLAAGPAFAAPVEQVVQLPSEGGAVLPYLLDDDDGRPPAAVALLFTGGEGVVGLRTRGIPRPGRNFLVRSRGLFVARGLATAVFEAPSDWDTTGMTDAQRMSDRHARDVAAVVDDLGARYPGVPVFLVGTSRGTVSAAHAGLALGPRVAGVVLTSSVFVASRGGGPGLSAFDFGALKVPLFFVHHTDDRCFVTPYAAARRLGERFPLASLSGGEPPRSGPCEAMSAHGYLGIEDPAVAAIVGWMRQPTTAAPAR